MGVLFQNRFEAGRILASMLSDYAGQADLVVLALPRGGVPVGFEIAGILKAVLDVFVVRKLGVPGHEELAMGAIATGGVRVLNTDVVQALAIPDHVIEQVAEEEQHELVRREQAYRMSRAAPSVQGHTAILVDDGLATGSTMRAAVTALRQIGPRRIIVAVPVGSRSARDDLNGQVDEIICAATPEPFYGVGQWYEDFSQTTDEEVRELLNRARHGKDHESTSRAS